MLTMPVGSLFGVGMSIQETVAAAFAAGVDEDCTVNRVLIENRIRRTVKNFTV
jgi:hypothetical protein